MYFAFPGVSGEGHIPTILRARVGPLTQTKHPRIGGPRLGGSGRPNLPYFTCLGGSERFISTYFTCPEGSKRFQEVQILTDLIPRVGSLKETLDSGGSEGSMSGARKLEVWM